MMTSALGYLDEAISQSQFYPDESAIIHGQGSMGDFNSNIENREIESYRKSFC